MYSEKILNVYFWEKMFFEIFVAKGEIISINEPPSFLEVMILIF